MAAPGPRIDTTFPVRRDFSSSGPSFRIVARNSGYAFIVGGVTRKMQITDSTDPVRLRLGNTETSIGRLLPSDPWNSKTLLRTSVPVWRAFPIDSDKAGISEKISA